MTKIGLLGGSFDPPHLGHLHVARAAHLELRLDSVRLIPAAAAPHKQGRVQASAADRLEMARRLASSERWLSVDPRELHRGGTSYTFDTLTELHAELSGTNSGLWFLIGADSLIDLPGWHRAAELVRLATFVTIPREDSDLDEARALLRARLPDHAEALLANVLSVDRVPVSSSQIRARCRAGLPIDELVPASVAEWIRSRRLYRDEGRAAAP
jgi:nicotinate-nucleotide adenylyltransferase